MVERNLAKVEVAGSSPVIRLKRVSYDARFLLSLEQYAGKRCFPQDNCVSNRRIDGNFLHTLLQQRKACDTMGIAIDFIAGMTSIRKWESIKESLRNNIAGCP